MRPAALALALLVALPACSFFQAPVVLRGNRISDEQLSAITPGVQTRNDVQTLLGSPTQTAMFGNGAWYYISSRTRVRPAREAAVTDQETVAITFDDRGVVRDVRRVTEADGRPVAMVQRETPTPGNERTFLQALFGNIGRVNPLGGISANQTPGVSAPAPTTGR